MTITVPHALAEHACASGPSVWVVNGLVERGTGHG